MTPGKVIVLATDLFVCLRYDRHGDQDFSDSQASTTMLTTRLIPAPLSQGSRGGSALRLSLIIWIGGDRRWMVRLEQTGCLDNFCWLAQGISVR